LFYGSPSSFKCSNRNSIHSCPTYIFHPIRRERPGKLIVRSIFAVQFFAYTCQQWIHPGEKFLGREATERSVPHPLVAHSANAALDVLCVGDAAERCGNHVAMFESGDELRAFGGIVAKPMEEYGDAPLR